MADEYDHKEIEVKWQKRWAEGKLYETKSDSKKPKQYILDMFPYPSGEGLHVGHPKGYIATDVYSRFKRMSGFEVLHPMGWDAFGLPAENFAIKHKVHPRVAVEKNIANFKQQLSHIGFSYDWSREINTTDPNFYKWTQWIFLKLFEKGLAYESNEPINWCPSCQTGLANEDVNADGTCERCDSKVEKRPMRQWVLKITDYADRMLSDLETLTEWPEHIKEAQRNWIGRSEGAEIDFPVAKSDQKITVFTTRPDTLYGATYMVLAPEHELVSEFLGHIENKEEVSTYVKKTTTKTDIERTAEGKEKTGVLLKGIKAVNPANNEEIPIFVADYVLVEYGTGAIMAVPAHDERDLAFANAYKLPIKEVITENGTLRNSKEFDGMNCEEAKKKIIDYVGGTLTNTYRIQDWVFSRQRYWGEPIPIIHCDKCGAVSVPEEQLPIRLPEVKQYEPTGTGESPLATIDEWVNVICPKCKGPGKRETNTMPQWAGSSWYWLRFMDPHNNLNLVDKKVEEKWGPVDVYVGGDHAVRHLIYARFWHKFLYDIGMVSTPEPFSRLEFLGFVLAEDGRKMSKRWGNIINPDDVVKTNGADAFRTYEMFMGPFENTVPWSTNGLVGAQRFVEKVWRLSNQLKEKDNENLSSELHRTIKKVTEDIESFKFNTAVSQMMIFINAVEKSGNFGKNQFEIFLKIFAPFAPHLTEELWEKLGHTTSIHLEKWPEFDAQKALSEEVDVVVQINGKTRGVVSVARGALEADVREAIEADAKLVKYLDFEAKKVIFVPDKIINFVA